MSKAQPLELRILPLEELEAAAARIVAAPQRAVQRVSIDEVYTFALFTRQAGSCLVLAARLVAGAATDAERTALCGELETLGLLTPDPQPEPAL